jgi:hypothetical protein
LIEEHNIQVRKYSFLSILSTHKLEILLSIFNPGIINWYKHLPEHGSTPNGNRNTKVEIHFNEIPHRSHAHGSAAPQSLYEGKPKDTKKRYLKQDQILNMTLTDRLFGYF